MKVHFIMLLREGINAGKSSEMTMIFRNISACLHIIRNDINIRYMHTH